MDQSPLSLHGLSPIGSCCPGNPASYCMYYRKLSCKPGFFCQQGWYCTPTHTVTCHPQAFCLASDKSLSKPGRFTDSLTM